MKKQKQTNHEASPVTSQLEILTLVIQNYNTDKAYTILTLKSGGEKNIKTLRRTNMHYCSTW